MRATFDKERPFLQSPTTHFEHYRICQRTVHFDDYIEVDSAYYSAPPRYIGQKVVRMWALVYPHPRPDEP